MSSLLKNLEEIISEMQVHKGFSRDKFFEDCIKKKLNNIVDLYNLDLDYNTNFLATRDSERVLRTITKQQKLKDRELLKSYMNQKRKKKEEKEEDSDD